MVFMSALGVCGIARGAASEEQANSQTPSFQQRYPRYRLEGGDVVNLNFRFTPDYNQTVTVQPDGYITLMEVGEMHVKGMTAPELVQALRNAYGPILHDPVITADIKDFQKPYFIVGGQVNRPGKYDLRGDTTVLQAIAIAGDFNERSKVSQVLLLRRVSDEWVETKKVDMKKMLRLRDLSEDLHLRPGDMVFVPKSALPKLEHFIPVPSIGMFMNPFSF